MPYIKQEEREVLDPLIWELQEGVNKIFPFGLLERAGRFNYAVTRLLQGVFPPRGGYWIKALACGVLLTIILEFYRRDVAHYEDNKAIENGDVY